MINDIINVGIPSKGRLRKDVLNIFKKRKLRLFSERGERDLLASIKGNQGSALPGGQSRAIDSLTSTNLEIFSARSKYLLIQ